MAIGVINRGLIVGSVSHHLWCARAQFLIGNTILFQSFYKQAYEIVLDALISGPIYHDLIWFLIGHDASSFYVIEMHNLHNTSSRSDKVELLIIYDNLSPLNY